MGLGATLKGYHRFDGLRAIAHGRTMEMAWPDHPVYPSHGYVVRRCDLDAFVADHAVGAGATLLQGTEGLRPLDPPPGSPDGAIGGAVVLDKASGTEHEIRARHVDLADGANSRSARVLGPTCLLDTSDAPDEERGGSPGRDLHFKQYTVQYDAASH